MLKTWFQQDLFADAPLTAGFELEAWLIDQACSPMPENEKLIESTGDLFVVPELSKFNIELNGTPRVLELNALSMMQSELDENWHQCNEVAEKLGGQMSMIGILPTVSDSELTLENMSGFIRYRALNEQVLKSRRGRPLMLNIDGRQSLHTRHNDVMLESAATSFQIHLQVNLADSTRFYNAALIASAPVVAAAANSPYLFDRDLWDETRIPLFEQAVAINGNKSGYCGNVQRVSFGAGYIENSLYEVFSENRDCFPVLLAAHQDEHTKCMHHVRLHNGTIWRWNRPLIGFDEDGSPHLRIEHRVVPAGPTPVDCFANAAFFYGLVVALAARKTAPESTLDFQNAKQNFYNAARSGLNSTVNWIDGKNRAMHQLIHDELVPLAREGLDSMNISSEDIARYLDIISDRVCSQLNGAAWQRAYKQKNSCDMRELTSVYQMNSLTGMPVHEWSL